jgi:hypothetical protein
VAITSKLEDAAHAGLALGESRGLRARHWANVAGAAKLLLLLLWQCGSQPLQALAVARVLHSLLLLLLLLLLLGLLVALKLLLWCWPLTATSASSGCSC